MPQAPQFATSADVFASQPVAGSPSQSEKPALQVVEHAPALQDAAALTLGEHGVQAVLAQPTVGSSFETQLPLQVFWAAGQAPEPPSPSVPGTVAAGSSPTQATTTRPMSNADAVSPPRVFIPIMVTEPRRALRKTASPDWITHGAPTICASAVSLAPWLPVTHRECMAAVLAAASPPSSPPTSTAPKARPVARRKDVHAARMLRALTRRHQPPSGHDASLVEEDALAPEELLLNLARQLLEKPREVRRRGLRPPVEDSLRHSRRALVVGVERGGEGGDGDASPRRERTFIRHCSPGRRPRPCPPRG